MAPTPPPTPATIPTIFTITAGQQAIITTTGAPGTSVQVQTSSDLVTWSGLATVTVDTSGRASYTFVPPETAYYRACEIRHRERPFDLAVGAEAHAVSGPVGHQGYASVQALRAAARRA